MSVLPRLFMILSIALPVVAASPIVHSVTPSSGPAAGGTTVVIRGTNFSFNCITCSPPFADPLVYFDNIPAPSVRFVDSTTLEVVTPPHLPGTASVTVMNLDGSEPPSDTLENGFTYTGEISEAFDPLLFPIFLPPIPGAHGSEFRTTARLWNKSATETITLYGYDRTCSLIDPPIGPETPMALAPRDKQALRLWPECSSTVGRLLYVPKGDHNVAASLRVWETSRQAENHGVEIPVARIEDFSTDSIALVDVPTDPKFRLTLRVYGRNRGETLVNLWYGSGSGTCCADTWNSLQLPMQAGRNIFEPSYAVFTDFDPAEGFPPFPETINVLVQSHDGHPIWAFLTVTNNETQHITTITPQQ